MPNGWKTGSGSHGTIHEDGSGEGQTVMPLTGENLRDVWTIPAAPYRGANFACVDAETEALTPSGWRRGDELSPGGRIAGYDMESGLCRWDTLQEVAHYAVEEEPMVRVHGRSIDQMLTPNHRCVIQRRSGVRAIVRADGLKPSHMSISAAPWSVGGTPFPTDLAALIGWYVTEGNAGEDRITLYQSGDANPEYCDEIRTLLRREGAVITEASRVRRWRDRDVVAVSWRVTGAVANMLLALCPDKRLPDGFLEWDESALRALWDALMKGDGHFRGGGRSTFVQCDRAVIDQVQALACRLGMSTSLTRRSQGTWALYVTESRTRRLRSETGDLITTVPYAGEVWCPRTTTGTWVARRGGRVFVTGNTFLPDLVKPSAAHERRSNADLRRRHRDPAGRLEPRHRRPHHRSHRHHHRTRHRLQLGALNAMLRALGIPALNRSERGQ